MLSKTLFIAVGLTLGIGLCATSSTRAESTTSITIVAQDNSTITGAISDVIFGNDGYTYFILGGKLLKMKTANFPDPIPAEGTKMTATGCTPDPDWDGGYICTGLK